MDGKIILKWTYLAQDDVQLLTLWNKIINFQVQNFSTKWKIISRRTSLYVRQISGLLASQPFVAK
jgi:hypothetical protein